MASTIIDEIYQYSFNSELEKLAGIPRFGIAKKTLEFVQGVLNKEKMQQEDSIFKKTKLFKQLRKHHKKELKSLKKHWRRQQKLNIPKS